MTLSLTKPVAGQEFQQFSFPLNLLCKLGRGVVLDWQIFQSLGREKFVDAIFSVLFFWWLTKQKRFPHSITFLHASSVLDCSTFSHLKERLTQSRVETREGIIESEMIRLHCFTDLKKIQFYFGTHFIIWAKCHLN